MMKKHGKNPGDYRPDILHQELLALLDSPLNKAGKLRVYVHSASNVLIEVNPKCRIPRTYKRFAGLMGASRLVLPSSCHCHCRLVDSILGATDAPSYHALPLAPPTTHPPKPAVQLLHKLKVRSADGKATLLKVVKNPISRHLPPGCKCYGMSVTGCLYNPMALACALPEDKPVVFVIGAMAAGHITLNDHPYVRACVRACVRAWPCVHGGYSIVCCVWSSCRCSWRTYTQLTHTNNRSRR